jgi:hypothetical protein
MRNPVKTLANDTHRDKPVVNPIFDKFFAFIVQQFLRNENSKTTRISPDRIYYRFQQGLQNAVFPNYAETCFSKKELGKIINPLHDFG